MRLTVWRVLGYQRCVLVMCWGDSKGVRGGVRGVSLGCEDEWMKGVCLCSGVSGRGVGAV